VVARFRPPMAPVVFFGLLWKDQIRTSWFFELVIPRPPSVVPHSRSRILLNASSFFARLSFLWFSRYHCYVPKNNVTDYMI